MSTLSSSVTSAYAALPAAHENALSSALQRRHADRPGRLMAQHDPFLGMTDLQLARFEKLTDKEITSLKALTDPQGSYLLHADDALRVLELARVGLHLRSLESAQDSGPGATPLQERMALSQRLIENGFDNYSNSKDSVVLEVDRLLQMIHREIDQSGAVTSQTLHQVDAFLQAHQALTQIAPLNP